MTRRNSSRGRSGAHSGIRKAPAEPMVFITEWCRAKPLLYAIEQQARLERIGAKRLGQPPETSAAERAALDRVYTGCIAERDLAEASLRPAEQGVFDAWQAAGPMTRECLLVHLNSRLGVRHA